MEIEKVRELVQLVEESGIEELEISHKDTTIRIQKCRTAEVIGAATIAAPPLASYPAAAPAEAPAASTPEPAEAVERAQWMEIRSPIVGTFYRAASPETPPFVNVGDRVAPGQTLCIVEAMKVMNEIEAEFGGVIKEVLVDDANPVEAEAIMFLVDPA